MIINVYYLHILLQRLPTDIEELGLTPQDKIDALYTILDIVNDDIKNMSSKAMSNSYYLQIEDNEQMLKLTANISYYFTSIINRIHRVVSSIDVIDIIIYTFIDLNKTLNENLIISNNKNYSFDFLASSVFEYLYIYMNIVKNSSLDYHLIATDI